MIDINIKWVLENGQKMKASDIHILPDEYLVYRVNGSLQITERFINGVEIVQMAKELLSENGLEQLHGKKEHDFAYEDNAHNRYRMNFHFINGKIGISIRILQNEMPIIELLDLPSGIYNLLENKNGLIIISGATGSGKTTTLSAIIDYLNKNKDLNIITIEDPVEYVFKSQKSIIRQREIGKDTDNFQNALRSALRQDPDVIMLGEMRDLESIEMAITIAETGHLVLGTLHTIGAVESIDRIIDVFPKEKQSQIRTQLSNVLRGVLNQQLVKSAEGNLVGAYELMINNQAIKNHILSGKSNQIYSIMESSSKLGMITMKKAIEKLFVKNIISKEIFEKLI
ncbi:type IV pilus twitching motility protein PilT [Fusobacterium sp. PH5-44]|uniref:type IV pilus twitching motility protein PilT n=1 Tax=unclassified Fusobacterium TaxID=2648384 RepID=UPI003D1FB586